MQIAGGMQLWRWEMAEELGRLLAEEGHILLCGGLGGVMEAACKGAAEAGGTVVGILPGERGDANPYVGIRVRHRHEPRQECDNCVGARTPSSLCPASTGLFPRSLSP